MSTVDDWVADAASALGLPKDSIDPELRNELLDLTREAAHGIARIAGPLTTYLVGLAAGAGMSQADAIERLTALAQQRAVDRPDDGSES